MGQSSPTLSEIEQQLSLRLERFRATTGEILALIRDDLPGYFQREARAAFLASPERAAALDDERLGKFKAAAEEAGRGAAQALNDALRDEGAWLDGPSETESPRTLEDATAVRAALGAADARLASLLDEYGLGIDPGPHYHAPVYFVGGRYFPALAEHYWKLRRELAELEADRAAAQAAVTREGLVARWDKA